MANFSAVNTAIRKAYPRHDIELARGHEYAYFTGDDGFDKIPSIMAHPPSTSTEDMTRMALEQISLIKRTKT